ncbi:transcription factor MYB56-like isoform X2 [Salvia splendens]|uniref:transcription factor MYB56-like isoform X2 n=1 Tax=Salvia splendens TaxID=180675 RepID=UPI001C278C4A|nr:transcription factor MYB56-like isoform X2 [Salvia splendens]XP_042020002.1 transcription factor MYB56-like isoform X2 [Salvia splendens]
MYHHRENAGGASLIDRLLRPMFSLGFSGNPMDDRPDQIILGFQSSDLNYHEEEEEEEEETSYKNTKRNEENPNSISKRRENGGTKFCARGHWKPSEDAKLKELVSAYGPQNWNLIAERLEGRSGKSCRLRWYNQLDPTINKKAFTDEEEDRLMEAHRMYGNKWALISRLFPGRTDNSLKNHWHVLMARRSRDKPKSYMKMKWACSKTPPLEDRTRTTTMQESVAYNYNSLATTPNYYGEHGLFDYQHFNHGSSYSPGSTSQISFAAPVSSSTSAAYHYQDAHCYQESVETPTFIDFLGVGSI